jgi:hypothetical protein
MSVIKNNTDRHRAGKSRLDEELLVKVHDTTGNNPRAWYSSVEVLTEAAKRIHDSTELQLPDGTEMMPARNAVYAMLLGYALECALKGLWVKAGKKIIDNGKYVGVFRTRDHEIGKLARAIAPYIKGEALSDIELNVLDRISSFVIFAGRYPVPKTPDQMTAVDVPTGGQQVPWMFTSEDFRCAELLLNRFTTALNPFLSRNS